MKKSLAAFVILACVLFLCRQFSLTRRIDERLFVLERMVDEMRDRLTELDACPAAFSADSVSLQLSPKPPTKKVAQEIPPKEIPSQNNPSQKAPSQNNPLQEKSRKFANPILLNLNTVDSATLVRVPGIGATSARVIINYREQLGGFYSPRQLAERLNWDAAQERMDEWCELWFKAEPKMIRRLDVNSADFRQLLRHPYLDYNQVKALVNYRDKHSRLPGFEALRMLEEFSEDDISRLEYYLEF